MANFLQGRGPCTERCPTSSFLGFLCCGFECLDLMVHPFCHFVGCPPKKGPWKEGHAVPHGGLGKCSRESPKKELQGGATKAISQYMSNVSS